MEGRAYFMDPNGIIIPVHGRHILDLITYPDKFGYTTEGIEEIYKKHKEPMGSEGNAREEILIALVNKGWARIREYNKYPSYWSIQVNQLNRRTKELLDNFAEQAIKGKGPFRIDGKVSKEDEMRVLSLKDNKVIQETFGNIAKGKLYAEDDIKEISKDVKSLNQMIRLMTPQQKKEYAKEHGMTANELRFSMGESIDYKLLKEDLPWCEIWDYQPKKKLIKYIEKI